MQLFSSILPDLSGSKREILRHNVGSTKRICTFNSSTTSMNQPSETLARYERFGWDYEFLNELDPAETEWYLTYARRVSAPVIELACGSGRLLIELAREGVLVWGLDLSPGMLELARHRLASESVATQSRVSLVQADMTCFYLNHRIGLAVIADNSFREATSAERQRAALACIRRHLTKDGWLLMALREYERAALSTIPKASSWSDPVTAPNSGDVVSRRVETSLSEDGSRLRSILRYRAFDQAGIEYEQSFVTESPLMSREDYVILLENCGYSVLEAVSVWDGTGRKKLRLVCRAS